MWTVVNLVALEHRRPMIHRFSDRLARIASRFYSTIGQEWLAAGLCVLACAFLVLGAKFWLIHANGSVTPFWDQWDAEAAGLYEPYLMNRLTLRDLLAAHNEHRILFTRLLALLLLEMAGQWDPLLQMVTNAIFDVIFVVILVITLGTGVSKSGYFGLCLFAGVLFSIPFGWENTLGGFQSPFYFLLILSTTAIILIMPANALSGRWWLGTVTALSSVLCLSSGALTLVPVIVLRCIQLALSVRGGWREYIGIGLQVTATIAAIATVPTVKAHDPLKAHSIGEFTSALWTLTGWPLLPHWWSPVLVFLPLLILFAFAYVRRPTSNDPIWISLGVGLWVATQLASLAYGRAVAVTASRYLDIVLVGLVANFAAVSRLVSNRMTGTISDLAGTLIAWIWVAVIVYSALDIAVTRLPSEVAHKREIGRIQTENVRAFLKSGDAAVLNNKPFLYIPYPNSERLIGILQDETIRPALPKDLIDDILGQRNVHERLLLKGQPARCISRFKTSLLESSVLLLALSFALFTFAIPALAL
jgi:hypothetical protein